MKQFITALLLGTGLVTTAWAHDMPAMAPASPEFQQIKQLVGDWQGITDENGKTTPVITSYKLTSGGSAVEETLMAGSPQEMVDMYFDEGGKLTMTHFCAMGNRPHMVLKKAEPGRIVLEMGSTPGIDAAKDMHMHSLTLEIKDANHLVQRWTNYTNGKPGETVVLTFTRIKHA